MSSTTIHSLIYKVVADSQQFTKGITATRTELSAAKKLFAESRTDVEKYGMSLAGLNKLHQKGAIDAETHRRAVDRLGKEFMQAAAAAAALTKAKLGLAAVSGADMAGATGLSKFAGPLAIGAGVSAAASVTTGFLKEAIGSAAEFEKTEVSMKTLLGSMDAAKAVIGDLTTFAAATPFEFPELADSTKKLIAFGVAQDDLIPTLRRIGDISSGLGIPLGELAELYGKAKVQGRLFAQDVNQLTGRGIPVIQEFAKQFGVAESEVRELVESGQIGFDNLQKAFIDLTSEGGKFDGMMAEQSQTMLGLTSTLKDDLNVAMREFGQIITEEIDLKGLIRDALQATAALREMMPAVKAVASVTTKPLIQSLGSAVLGPSLGGALSMAGAARGLRGETAPEASKSKISGGAGELPEKTEFKEIPESKKQSDAERLRRELADLGRSEEERFENQLKDKGLGPAERVEPMTAFRELAAEKQRMKEAEDIAKMRRGNRDRVDIGGLNERDDATAATAIGRLTKDADADVPKPQRQPSRTAGPALMKGTAEAFSAIIKAKDGGGSEPVKKTEKNTERTFKAAEAQLEEMKRANAAAAAAKPQVIIF